MVDYGRYGSERLPIWLLFRAGGDWYLIPLATLFAWAEPHHGHTKGWRRYWSWPSILKTLREFLQPYVIPPAPSGWGQWWVSKR